ncbi:hypothetical protein AJ80_08543 [Polytolypa hystricis UAMH7299]|uniref:Methyltransferase domain-containing protein n=1 Tax=Polytolypa hystricis (strain UAMH7299) TaxID=1447883 RepID=A0A2B7X630_POLH7|nr:hypothetical protein AJ80_08543 [Polytolypa hystricis UAMH7299]
MIPKSPLPLSAEWTDTDDYVQSLLSFATTSQIFINLCGGVHVLDFLTREPDLYTTILPQEWREFFDEHDIGDILDLLLRENIELLRGNVPEDENVSKQNGNGEWRSGSAPPPSLVEYIYQIRRHCLGREFTPIGGNGEKASPSRIPIHVAVGMKPKKSHEVENFSRYVDSLTASVNEERGANITHIVDFGSGQNYLGRNLASPPYDKHIIAIERHHHNLRASSAMDVHAKLKKKVVVMRNKKQYKLHKLQGEAANDGESDSSRSTPSKTDSARKSSSDDLLETAAQRATEETVALAQAGDETAEGDRPRGSMEYIEHDIKDGYLEPVIQHAVAPSNPPSRSEEVGDQQKIEASQHSCASPGPQASDAQVMVISLHSCGNLVHHGIRSLVLNPSVVAIAMIGCCYNLMTERLGPATYKLPALRSHHHRLQATSQAYDPHGFPMSNCLENFPHRGGKGIKFNITARMMAVQAPYNWGPKDSEGFFTRHFFRALLQHILVDYGVVPAPGTPCNGTPGGADGNPGEVAVGTALMVGSMPKAAFSSFATYARAAVTKLSRNEHYGAIIQEKVACLSDEQLAKYERDYKVYKKKLSIVWSLMAFSAGVVESVIVADRWMFLREQEDVKHAWVEPVFEYGQSPRNLVVVGVKK